MTTPLVVLDADVLGRERTGDETYVENLLRALPKVARGELRFAAVTRNPGLVPAGIEPVQLPARSQEVRMAWALPRLLRRIRPALAHFQHVIAPRCPSPAIVTVHDLSFERDSRSMGAIDRIVFRLAVPRSAHRAEHILAVSERTKRDLVELYDVAPEKITVTPHGVDPHFTADGRPPGEYLLFVGAIQKRKHPLAASDAAAELGLPLVVAGPAKDADLARELARRGAVLRGYVSKSELAELYRGAACLVMPSRFEGFGLPLLEAMACGTPVVAGPDLALREVGGDAVLYARPPELAGSIRRALAERERLAAAGIERAREFSWEETARRTLEVYRRVVRALLP